MLDKVLSLIYGIIILLVFLLPFLLAGLVVIMIIYSIFAGKEQRPPYIYSLGEIEEYMKNNEMINYIENENIYISISDYHDGLYIRCVNKKKQEEFFTVTGSIEMLGTCWAVVQKYSYFIKYNYNGLFYWFDYQYKNSRGELFLTINR